MKASRAKASKAKVNTKNAKHGVCIVGSGPSGIACAKALAKEGVKVTILDVGNDLEENKKQILSSLQAQETWDKSLLKKIRNTFNTKEAAPTKGVYGSTYAYDDASQNLGVKAHDVICRPSFAKGGLSSVWGAALLPYMQADNDGQWPFPIETLDPYYRKVLEFMPLATKAAKEAKKTKKQNANDTEDSLQFFLPLFTQNIEPLEQSKQASVIEQRYSKNKNDLQKQGIFLGPSRLAIRTTKNEESNGCVYCGLCLHGCPNEVIYNTKETLNKLIKEKQVSYKDNCIVGSFQETKDGIIIEYQGKTKSKKETIVAKKLILAAGVIPSAAIITKSMDKARTEEKKEILIKDSQHFMLPCMMYSGVKGVKKEKLHTLSQLNIEIMNLAVDEHSVHLQLYTYMDLYEQDIKRRCGFIYPLIAPFIEPLLARIILIKGYLHQDSSDEVTARREDANIVLKRKKNKRTKRAIKNVCKLLFRNRKNLGIIPLQFMLKATAPGSANHYGASFPMRKDPKKMQTNTNGLLFGFKNVHLADASVLPAIHAQSPTLTIMANAYRIGEAIAREEAKINARKK